MQKYCPLVLAWINTRNKPRSSSRPSGLVSQVIRRRFSEIKKHHPRLSKLLEADTRNAKFALVDAQLVVAREHGFVSWPKFAKHVEALIREGSVVVLDNPWAAFIEAAWVPRDSGHASGTLERAEAIIGKRHRFSIRLHGR